MVVAALAALLLMRNWQRAGVAANTTVEEFRNVNSESIVH